MKKLFCAIIAIFLVTCNSAVAEIDLSSMSYDELVSMDASIHQELAERTATNDLENKVSNLLYEDDYMSIEFSNLYTKETSYDTYLMTEYIIKNKTDKILRLVCDYIIIDGCAIHISKYVEVPPKAMTINEWTSDAEQYLKYGIENPSTLTMMFDYEATDDSFDSGTIMSEAISIGK